MKVVPVPSSCYMITLSLYWLPTIFSSWNASRVEVELESGSDLDELMFCTIRVIILLASVESDKRRF